MLHRFAISLSVFIISIAVGGAQTAPAITSVYNAASYQGPGLQASGIAQGSIFTLFGTGLGPAVCSQAPATPLHTSMCGVSLTVTVNGASTAPDPLGVYYGQQINAILPSNTPTGSGTITVTYNNQASATFPIQVAEAAFGAFTPSGYGFGQASVTDANYQLNTIIHTLHPGDIGILWGTGLGPISGSDATAPTTFPNIGTPTVYVGSTAVTPGSGLLYAGRSGSWPGLDQINFTVPQGVQGCAVPIAVQTNGEVGNVATIAVSAAGQNTCSDSIMGQDLIDKLASGSPVAFGYVRLERNASVFIDSLGDNAYATFSSFTPQTAFYAAYGVSSGYCITNSFSPFWMSDSSFPAAVLDAGNPLSLLGPRPLNGSWNSASPYAGYFPLDIGAAGNYLLNNSNYTVSGTGGADIGPFSAAITTPAAITGLAHLSGLTVDQTIPRSSDLTVQWTGGAPTMQNGQVTIGGFSVSGASNFNYWTSFQCTAPLAANQLTIPSWVLSALPQTGQYPINGSTVPAGSIWIGQYGAPVTFTATGLDRGVLTDVFYLGLSVNFQ